MSAIYRWAGDLMAQCREEWAAFVDTQITTAETDLKGVLVNRAGLSRGITADDLFTGPASRAFAYATPELMEWWWDHPRRTFAQFERMWLDARHGTGRS